MFNFSLLLSVAVTDHRETLKSISIIKLHVCVWSGKKIIQGKCHNTKVFLFFFLNDVQLTTSFFLFSFSKTLEAFLPTEFFLYLSVLDTLKNTDKLKNTERNTEKVSFPLPK